MALWWQTGIVYQIYPRSFQDSNNDGIGDLPGIIQRLDYLQWLGIDAIWISPIYPSPMADFGYDVSDYTGVHPMFGTLGHMDELIKQAHGRNIRVILDYVPNHSSDQHPWFIESRSSRDNPKRDWYIWRDPAPDGGPPNNWLGRFDGKSAWEWDEATGQYYLHSFLKEQPDLNWRSEGLREAMLDVMRFWFDKGIDGLRVDVSYRAMKDADLRDNPPNPDFVPGKMDPSKAVIEKYTRNTPDIHQFNRWLRQVADEYPERVLIGEINLPLVDLVAHYGENLDGFHLPFNFRLVYQPWTPEIVRTVVETYEQLLPEGAWPNYVLGNHDVPRFATRAGAEQTRNGMLALLTLRGTPTMYYGEELGMANVPIPKEKVVDPWGKFTGELNLGRDPERTPMQWDASPNAGFTKAGVEPWLPLAGDYAQVNVEAQRDDPTSMLNFTRRLIEIRRTTPALTLGDLETHPTPEGTFLYERSTPDNRYFVALNFTAEPQTLTLPEAASVLLSTEMDAPQAVDGASAALRPNEGLLLEVD